MCTFTALMILVVCSEIWAPYDSQVMPQAKAPKKARQISLHMLRRHSLESMEPVMSLNPEGPHRSGLPRFTSRQDKRQKESQVL